MNIPKFLTQTIKAKDLKKGQTIYQDQFKRVSKVREVKHLVGNYVKISFDNGGLSLLRYDTDMQEIISDVQRPIAIKTSPYQGYDATDFQNDQMR
jgi:hypothetical protein